MRKIQQAALVYEYCDSLIIVTGQDHGVCQRIALQRDIPQIKFTAGFIDNTLRFVGREEALEIAKEAGQLLSPFKTGITALTSHDIKLQPFNKGLL